METWVGRILWKPPSQMHNQASQHQPDEADLHLPWKADKEMQAGSLHSYWSLHQGHSCCP